MTNKGPKKTLLLEHMTSGQYLDGNGIIVPTNGRRGNPGYFGRPGGWAEVCRMISRMRNVAWVPDANVAFLPAARPVWDALRAAALGERDGSTIITGTVEAEMKEWLAMPFHQPDLAAMIKEGIGAATWLRTLREKSDHPLYDVFTNYAFLLGFRRTLAIPFEDGKTILGTEANDKAGTMNKIAKCFGKRAVAAAKKGRDEFDKKGKVSLNDEMHCVMTIINALQNRRPSIILTADKDHIETFFKAQRLIDMHYRCWLAAPMVQEGYFGPPVKEVMSDYFEGPLTVYRRITQHNQEFLPAITELVTVGMVYVAPDEQLHMLKFPFERPMLDMLAVRQKTGGSSTELFGDANLHIELGPVRQDVKLEGIFIGVGKDSKMTYTEAKGTIHLSKIDLDISASCFETFFDA